MPASCEVFPQRLPVTSGVLNPEALHPSSIWRRLHRLGIPNLNGRSRAIRELLLQAPAPVVAGMVGYHSGHAEQLAAQSGATWKRYAVGDHTKTRKPDPPIT
jgi:hypothetical protein